MKIKTIDISAREWFDKVNGNSYFAGSVTINYHMEDEVVLKMPFQYGYGSQYESEAWSTIVSNELIKNEGKNKKYFNRGNGDHVDAYWFCKDNEIIVRSNIITGCLKRELK